MLPTDGHEEGSEPRFRHWPPSFAPGPPESTIAGPSDTTPFEADDRMSGQAGPSFVSSTVPYRCNRLKWGRTAVLGRSGWWRKQSPPGRPGPRLWRTGNVGPARQPSLPDGGCAFAACRQVDAETQLLDVPVRITCRCPFGASGPQATSLPPRFSNWISLALRPLCARSQPADPCCWNAAGPWLPPNPDPMVSGRCHRWAGGLHGQRVPVP